MRIILFAGFALGCLLGIGAAPASAGSINGMQQVDVCDPTTNQGLNCLKPAADGSLPVSGTISATNPSVGTNAAAAPTSTTQIGSVDGSGNLQPASTTNPIPVSPSLPSGASTAANQTTGNTSLATIAGAVGNAIPAGTAIIGKVGIDQTTPGTTNAVQAIPGTTGGLTTFYLTAAASTNATNVKASAGQLYRAELSNNSATLAYVSFYNTSGTPTCGTSIVYQMMIPANSTSGAGWVSAGSMGLAFSSGIGICVTTGIAGTGNVAASAYTISLGYK